MARDSLRSQRDPRALVPGAQEGRRHPPTLPAGVVGPVLQRRVRRHLRQHLRAHRRGLRLRGAEGLRRAHRAGAAARARRRQGRPDRPAGREDLDRAVATPSSPRSASRWRRCSRRSTEQNAVAPAGFFETAQRPRAAARRPARSTRSRRSAISRSAPATARSASATSPTVHRGFADPAAPQMRFMGEDAIGIAVSMKDGGDIIELGETLDARVRAPAEDAAGRHASCARSPTSRQRCANRSASSCACWPRRWRSCCW